MCPPFSDSFQTLCHDEYISLRVAKQTVHFHEHSLVHRVFAGFEATV